MANDFKRFAKPSVGTSTGASADAKGFNQKFEG